MATSSRAFERRHDIDAVRTIAMGLLIAYHAMASFSPWSADIGFPEGEVINDLEPIAMAMNVWRIPILFVISGMAVRFAIERRSAQELLRDRAKRILLPFVAMAFLIDGLLAPATGALGLPEANQPTFGHLWFLGNIFLYVLVLLPVLAWVRRRLDNPLSRGFRHVVGSRVGLVGLGVLVVAEAWVFVPDPAFYEWYAFSLHGLMVGLVCFSLGYLLIDAGEVFWATVVRVRWVVLAVAVASYSYRVFVANGPSQLKGFETWVAILAILGFGAMRLNRPSRAFRYLSPAVYPVYIAHMPIQVMISVVIIGSPLPAVVELIVLTVSTLGLSMLVYEGVRRVRWLRPLFGLTGSAAPRPSRPTAGSVA